MRLIPIRMIFRKHCRPKEFHLWIGRILPKDEEADSWMLFGISINNFGMHGTKLMRHRLIVNIFNYKIKIFGKVIAIDSLMGG